MSRIIQADGVERQFPDDATPEEINAAFSTGTPKNSSLSDAFPRVSARIAANGKDTDAPALLMADAGIMDLLTGVAGAVQRTPVLGKALTLAGKGSDWFQHLIAPPGRDYPLQGTVEEVKSLMNRVPVLKDMQAPQTAVELAGRTVTDPLAYIGLVGEVGKAASLGSKLSEAPGLAARAIGSAATGISKDAISSASTEAGRAAMQDAVASQAGSGERLSGALKTFSQNIPERHAVDQALQAAPDIDIRPVLKAFQDSKIKPMGPMNSVTPGITKTNSAIDAYARAIQGDLPSPEQIAAMDFGGNLEKANAAIADPQSKWGILSGIAKKAGASADKSASVLDMIVPRAASAASETGIAKGNAVDLAQKAEKNVTRWGGASNAASDDYQNALTKASDLSQQAKGAYADAQAKAATGEITAADAAAAKSELLRAQTAMHIADATNEFSQGKSLDQVSRLMVDRHKISGDGLKSVLNAGRNNVGENSFTPNFTMSAPDYKRLREFLDQDIDFGTPEGKALDNALKGPRSVMKNTLEASVPGEYKDAMSAWADKLGLRDQIQELIGNHEGPRQDIRATNFIKAAAKDGPGGPRYEILKKFENAVGGGFSTEAKNAKMGLEFGPDGTVPLLPKGADRRIVSGLIGGAGFTAGGPIGAGATALATSPYALTRITIPAADRIGNAIGRAGSAASKIKASTPTKASALLQLLGIENR